MGDATAAMVRALGGLGPLGVLAFLGVGLFVCFLGLRYFRFSAGVVGMLVGVELAARLAQWQHCGKVSMVVLGLLGGAALAALLAVFAFLGVFGMGALLAVTLVSVTTGAAGTPAGPLQMVLAGLIGGFAGLLLRRHVAVVATSLYGGVMAIASVFTLVRRGDLCDAVSRTSGQLGHHELVVFVLCVAVLVTGGLVVQFRTGKHPQVDRGGK